MSRYARLVALACVLSGLFAAATASAGHAQHRGVPVVIVPVPPVSIGPPTWRTRGDLTWSTTGRAEVEVSVDRHHGRALAP